MNGKPFLASKTMWVSAITLAISVFGLIAGNEWIQTYPQIVAWIGVVVAVLMGILRAITAEPIKIGNSPKIILLSVLGASLLASSAFAEGWSVPDTATNDVELCKQVTDNPGFGIKERRDMGITIKNIREVTKKLKAEGQLNGLDRTEISAMVMSELVESNPKAFADPKLDWDRILQFIEMILKILALFGGL